MRLEYCTYGLTVCIVQDSLYDSEIEAAAIADICMNCEVTLVASSSGNSSEGLFIRARNGHCRIGNVQAQDGTSWPL
jgi:hypothetical protein